MASANSFSSEGTYKQMRNVPFHELIEM